MYEYIGAIHIHSNYSDGSKPIPEIAAIADSVGLNLLLFADHMTLKPLDDGLEGWHGRVLVLIGYEINDQQNRNHYLAFNLDEIIEPGVPAKEYVRKVKRGIVCMQCTRKGRMRRIPFPGKIGNSNRCGDGNDVSPRQ